MRVPNSPFELTNLGLAVLHRTPGATNGPF